ncbi:hypothetical protein ACIP2X_19315 [Streptomyces sp. NPDC089424]|uniref:hypothetical protein n=1 Tax=Streptomyces sp. NPDC089424 TaxID=3365917 RepID=UPI00380065E8
MKLGRIAAAAVISISIPFVGAAQPAEAANKHTARLQGTINVYECCGFLGAASDTQEREFDRTLRLAHGEHKWFKETECAGGEARGELTVNVRMVSDETLQVWSVLNLWEGGSCGSLDRDGYQSGATRLLPSGTAQTWVLSAANDEWHSADTTKAWFSVTHKVAP